MVLFSFLIVLIVVLIRQNNSLQLCLNNTYAELKTIKSQKKSTEVRTGQICEQFGPYLTDFPYDPKNTRFIGSPIDMIVFDFDANKLVFIEFKTGQSKENSRQKKVRQMIESGNVFYEAMRVS
jgi:predicted Holliday junction resolvase-like endonuclease